MQVGLRESLFFGMDYFTSAIVEFHNPFGSRDTRFDRGLDQKSDRISGDG
jgi:hypothetical protein